MRRVIAGLALLVAACGDEVGLFSCDGELISQYALNADRQLSVVSVDCGATTSLATWVLEHPADRPYRMDDPKVVVVEGEITSIDVSNDTISVRYRAGRLFHEVDEVAGKPVRYEAD